jgi:hypothetical protein
MFNGLNTLPAATVTHDGALGLLIIGLRANRADRAGMTRLNSIPRKNFRLFTRFALILWRKAAVPIAMAAARCPRGQIFLSAKPLSGGQPS